MQVEKRFTSFILLQVIMGTINQNGCSVCAAGQENHTTYNTKIGRKSVKRMQYDYRTPEGELFSCIGTNLEDCRRKRDEWISKNNLKRN